MVFFGLLILLVLVVIVIGDLSVELENGCYKFFLEGFFSGIE